MAKQKTHNVNVRVDPDLYEKMSEAIENKEYSSYSDCAREALQALFDDPAGSNHTEEKQERERINIEKMQAHIDDLREQIKVKDEQIKAYAVHIQTALNTQAESLNTQTETLKALPESTAQAITEATRQGGLINSIKSIFKK